MSERKPMTDDELAEIKGRLTMATPGPWAHGQNGGYVILGYKPEMKRIDGYGADDHICILDDGDQYRYRSEDEQLANAKFIANAPTDIARLLAEVERLRKQLDGLKKIAAFSMGCTSHPQWEKKYKLQYGMEIFEKNGIDNVIKKNSQIL